MICDGNLLWLVSFCVFLRLNAAFLGKRRRTFIPPGQQVSQSLGTQCSVPFYWLTGPTGTEV